jgi:hypothetical protein
MTVVELAQLVAAMRAAQKRWFDKRTRTASALSESIALEKRVDAAVKDVLAGPGLFDREGPG